MQDWIISAANFEELSSGEYAKAFDCFADLCDDFLTQAATGEPYDVQTDAKGKVSPFWLYTDLVVAFFISFGIVKGKQGI